MAIIIQHDIDINYTPIQDQVFFHTPKRFKLVAKGRRVGLTRGVANYYCDTLLDEEGPLLWVDTVNSNIDRYVKRYFYPVLQQIPKKYWEWNISKNKLTVMGQEVDFRSADRPENMEGFGYKKIFLNEAGIILKNPLLWHESIRPMAMDFKAECIIGGKPKGKRSRIRTLNEPGIQAKKEEHLFYTLWKRGMSSSAEWDDWAAFEFSSYDNPYLDPDEIDEMIKEVSPAIRDQEIFGKFLDSVVDQIIKAAWWGSYRTAPPKFIRKVQSWDTAFKKNEENDYNVCTTWGETSAGYFLLHWFRARMEYPELKRSVVGQYQEHRPDVVLVEDKASGQSLIQELQRDTVIPILPIPKDQDKVANTHAVTPIIESGRCLLPEADVASFNVGEFIAVNADFPSGEEDDTTDSVTQALAYLKQSTGTLTELTTRQIRKSNKILEGYD